MHRDGQEKDKPAGNQTKSRKVSRQIIKQTRYPDYDHNGIVFKRKSNPEKKNKRKPFYWNF